MDSIPADTLKQILELRGENGLEATKEALAADLAKSKAKWVLVETPRYRKAGRSPIYVSGKYLSSYGSDPATGEKDEQGGKKAKPASTSSKASSSSSAGKVDEAAFWKVLHGKGFAVKITQDLFSGEISTVLPPAVTKLGLKFERLPSNAEGVYVTQTLPQVQVSMPHDKFLELAHLKP